jgi:hypothetical protein
LWQCTRTACPWRCGGAAAISRCLSRTPSLRSHRKLFLSNQQGGYGWHRVEQRCGSDQPIHRTNSAQGVWMRADKSHQANS